MAQLSVSRAWDDTREIFARDGALLISVVLALIVFPGVVVGLVNPPVNGTASVLGRTVWIVAVLIGLIGQLALVRLALGPSTTVGQSIQQGARRFLPTAGALVLLFLGLALAAVPLMIVLMLAGVLAVPVEGQPPPPSFAVFAMIMAVASVLLSVKFMMLLPVSTAEQPAPFQLLKRSWALTRGHYWKLLGFILVLLVATLVMLIAAQFVGGILAKLVGGRIAPFSLGALVLSLFQATASAAVTALFCVMAARLYLQLVGDRSVAVKVPSSGT